MVRDIVLFDGPLYHPGINLHPHNENIVWIPTHGKEGKATWALKAPPAYQHTASELFGTGAREHGFGLFFTVDPRFWLVSGAYLV